MTLVDERLCTIAGFSRRTQEGLKTADKRLTFHLKFAL